MSAVRVCQITDVECSRDCDAGPCKLDNAAGTIPLVPDVSAGLSRLFPTEQEFRKIWGKYIGTYRMSQEPQITSMAADLAYTLLKKHITAAMQANATPESVLGDDVLKFLDELKDDAIAHIWPDDLERCNRSECVVKVYSVRMGGTDGSHTVPLFSREQVDAAVRAAQKG